MRLPGSFPVERFEYEDLRQRPFGEVLRNGNERTLGLDVRDAREVVKYQGTEYAEDALRVEADGQPRAS